MKIKKDHPFISIKIDSKSSLPVYEQIKLSLKIAIISGKLKEGDRLIPLREMAVKLQVNPNTILKVYNQLEEEGYITSRLRSGYYVSYKDIRLEDEKREILKGLTADYLSKAFEIGCSYEDISEQLSEILGKENAHKLLWRT